MARRKTERLLNLTITLLTAGRFVSRRDIRAAVDGYSDTSEAAFERQFERDKDELRGLGIPIITGNNDVWFDDEPGYRIARADFELPEIEFTADELTALGVAATAWQNTLVSKATRSAITKLRASGAEPDAERLTMLSPHVAAKEPAFEPLWAAVVARRVVEFRYKGERRRVQPWQLFSRTGLWYLIGHDEGRDAPRAFKLARFESVPTVVGADGAFRAPSADEVQAHAARLRPAAADKRAIVAIAGVCAPELRRRGVLVDDAPPLPVGYAAYDVPYAGEDDLVAEVCAAGSDALLLEPVGLRERVIERLRRAAGEDA